MKRLVFLLINFTINLFNFIKCINFETNNIILHQPVFSKNTNFGFSVAGYKVDNDSWILVGAPLTERERYHGQIVKSREGAVYRCRINTPNSCYMLPFDKKDWNEARDHYGIYHSENKTDQLLGATLIVNDDVILTCAPNYRYVTRMLGQDEFRYEPTGTCFTLRDKMRKFEEHSPCRNSMWGHHRQGYCQAGFSGAISKNDSSLFLTGPGAWYWQGMVFSINLYNKDIRHKYPMRSGEGNNDDSYRGYAIDIGHFDNDIYEDVVVSSPRGNNCKGYVEIFSSNFKLLHTIHGKQIGSYFGASLIAVDLNNDLSTDLVIGSPMYKKDTENYDLGRVDVFIRDKKSQGFVFRQITLNGFKARSRFGATLAKLGDINDDGFNDIAIAAPYDGEDNSGIIYIFNGRSDGIDITPSQIIKGSDYGLKSFGYSLSGGLDLDGNQYPDLIVGSYKSDAVAYIRAKPVIKTQIDVQTSPKLIDFDSKDNFCDKNKTRLCIDFEYCVEYRGKSVPKTMKILMNLELDIDKFQNKSLIRAIFGETKSNYLTRNHTFKSETKTCFKQTVIIKKNLRDKLTPIKCHVNLTLPNYDTDWELLPMFSSIKDSSKMHEIRFLRNCGTDDICIPNLQVAASTPTKKYIYGSQNYIDINIHVENTKEDAFESQCLITLPQGVNYVKAFITQSSLSQQLFLPCYQNKGFDTTRIICDIGNPMISGTSKSFTIRVAPQNIILDEEILKFNITVTSSNKEDQMTMFDNEHYVYVVLDAIPKLALIGKQYQEQVIYETKTSSFNKDVNSLAYETEFDIGPEIMHEYKILNKGPSQFSLSELLITWQNQIKIGEKNRDFLYLMEMPYIEGPIECSLENLDINPLNLSKLSDDKIRNPEKYYFETKKSKRSLFTDSNSNNNDFSSNLLRYFPTEFYLNSYGNKYNDNEIESVDCSSGIVLNSQDQSDDLINHGSNTDYLKMTKTDLYEFYCSTIHCKVGPLSADESALIRLRFRLYARTLALNPEIYSVKTSAMSIVTQIPYSNLKINLDQFQSAVQHRTKN
ncbi:unnamed protein product [Brachionus calyciflorus]|uniref:Uncharacterized protein n=1 Tax=Brachionus calyciflorus TaxID=104777 RepID=A0A813UA24_9BILA|nr:unnamed protein product [Brachionus calyciflorus]